MWTNPMEAPLNYYESNLLLELLQGVNYDARKFCPKISVVDQHPAKCAC